MHSSPTMLSLPPVLEGLLKPTTTGRPSSFVERRDERPDAGRFYLNPFWAPYFTRPTLRRQLDEWTWVFEQRLGLFNVSEIVRMTVLRLDSGGLFVFSPVAPTGECIALLNDIGGEVEYIVLPSAALEHKLFTQSFVKKYPRAEVFIAPGQFSYPFSPPGGPLGFTPDGVLTNDLITPFSNEIEHATFLASSDVGSAAEVAMFHKSSRTLLTVDSIALIDRRREERRDVKAQCSALQVLFFQCAPDVNPSGFFYNVPSKYDNWFDQLVVPPTVRKWVIEVNPQTTKEWLDRISRFKFDRIIPCHFDAPIAANTRDFLASFSFLTDRRKADATFRPGLAPFIESVAESLPKGR
ncbi:unnamed protein product [Vitrella brassicaformis CCMP3155]|uniref:DUF4336 domain-containing protein n=1 Tax=Vitrella brassicaformis (strain CCMP3155) TaxID=1169540 RepID=A0A0G4EGP9_VITBC|nr:unnamed protein product [Vitrella brassicaformis CCMP3155]|eukprot:CEL95629.1 unnamed protein product [Vitrella brassicaformis CCMP3155]